MGEQWGAAAVRALVEWSVVSVWRTAHRFWLSLMMAAASEAVARRELDTFDAWWDALVSDLVGDAGTTGADAQAVFDGVGVLVDGLVLSALLTHRNLSADRRRRVVDDWLTVYGVTTGGHRAVTNRPPEGHDVTGRACVGRCAEAACQVGRAVQAGLPGPASHQTSRADRSQAMADTHAGSHRDTPRQGRPPPACRV